MKQYLIFSLCLVFIPVVPAGASPRSQPPRFIPQETGFHLEVANGMWKTWISRPHNNLGIIDSLDISDNELSLFPCQLHEMSNLKQLFFRSNSIESCKDFPRLNKLEELWLDSNWRLNTLKDLPVLPELKLLSLSGTAVKSLRSMQMQPQLKQIFLSSALEDNEKETLQQKYPRITLICPND